MNSRVIPLSSLFFKRRNDKVTSAVAFASFVSLFVPDGGVVGTVVGSEFVVECDVVVDNGLAVLVTFEL